MSFFLSKENILDKKEYKSWGHKPNPTTTNQPLKG